MNIARILYPVKVLGPGDRVGIWLSGCSRGCKGCSNPELWSKKPEYELMPAQVLSLIIKIVSTYPVDGFTISGGEPMDQAEDLAELLRLMECYTDDIIVYSGYRMEDLLARHERATDYILGKAAVLIDGKYVEELNDGSVLRGSSNQRIHILNTNYNERYRQYLAETHNMIQNFTTADGIVSVGIHRKGFSGNVSAEEV